MIIDTNKSKESELIKNLWEGIPVIKESLSLKEFTKFIEEGGKEKTPIKPGRGFTLIEPNVVIGDLFRSLPTILSTLNQGFRILESRGVYVTHILMSPGTWNAIKDKEDDTGQTIESVFDESGEDLYLWSAVMKQNISLGYGYFICIGDKIKKRARLLHSAEANGGRFAQWRAELIVAPGPH